MVRDLGQPPTRSNKTADPVRAATWRARLEEACADRGVRLSPESLTRFEQLAGASDALARLVVRRPRRWQLAERRGERPPRELTRRFDRLPPADVAGFERRLRFAKQQRFLELGTADLVDGLGWQPLSAALTELHRQLLEASLRFHHRALVAQHGEPEGLRPGELGCVVLAMGKLGAGEINVSSDIDLVAFHAREGRTPGGPGGSLAHGAFFSRLVDRTARSLSEVTAEGFVARVDLDLRPEGRAGPTSLSLDRGEHYFLHVARVWERVAMAKARPFAGDLALGEELLSRIEPWLFRRAVDMEVVETLRSHKARLTRSASAQHGSDDLKHGPGGIREVEFFAQALQLLGAGRDRRLRERSVPGGLDALVLAGLLPGPERDQLVAAYDLLRRAEHRVQWVEERQTHVLPPGVQERQRIALGLGFDSTAAFEAALAQARGQVQQRFEGLLAAASDVGPSTVDPRWGDALDATHPVADRFARMAELGFPAEADALLALEKLGRIRTLPFGPPEPSAPAAALLELCRAAPDPTQALSGLADLLAGIRSPKATFDLLVGQRRAARLLLQLLGTSAFLGRMLLRRPELLPQLADVGIEGRPPTPQELEAEWAGHAQNAIDLEARLGLLGRWKAEALLRVALLDLSGALPVEGVGRALTDIAERIVAVLLEEAERELVARWGQPLHPDGRPMRVLVLGLGKLGGAELGYRSDLDLAFLYPGPGTVKHGARESSHAEWFSRLAQRLLALLGAPTREGALYAADARLRPSGGQGVLVSPASAFLAHHLERAESWEHQALLRARPVAGDVGSWEPLRQALEPALFGRMESAARLADVRRMRLRVELEVGREASDALDPKAGMGGLVDLEFLAQGALLAHGRPGEGPWPTSTLGMLRLAAARGWLAEGALTGAEEDWRWMRRLEDRLRIVHDAPLARLPTAGAVLDLLARRTGHGGASATPGLQLLAHYKAVAQRIRSRFDLAIPG